MKGRTPSEFTIRGPSSSSVTVFSSCTLRVRVFSSGGAGRARGIAEVSSGCDMLRVWEELRAGNGEPGIEHDVDLDGMNATC